MLSINYNRADWHIKVYIPSLNRLLGWHFVLYISVTVSYLMFTVSFFLVFIYCFMLSTFLWHNLIWQALSSAWVTLALPFPVNIKERTEENKLLFHFVCIPHRQTYQLIFCVCFCILVYITLVHKPSTAFAYLCFCCFLKKMQTGPHLCVRVPLAESMLGLAHTDGWEQKGFYISWRIHIVMPVLVNCLLSSDLLLPPTLLTFIFWQLNSLHFGRSIPPLMYILKYT